MSDTTQPNYFSNDGILTERRYGNIPENVANFVNPLRLALYIVQDIPIQY